MKHRRVGLLVLMFLLIAALTGCQQSSGVRTDRRLLRLGYMANLTHAQALIGVADGSFARDAGVTVEAKVFPAGPAAVTALLAGEIDMIYVGPSPAVNGYVRSNGKALKVVAGAASGGASFVVQPGFDPTKLDHARLASPGVANTQDISLRHLLRSATLKTTEQGGSVRITPAAPADIMSLFGRKQIDGAWVPEPWAARLELELGGKVAFDERALWPDKRFASTLLVVSADYLQRNRDVVRSVVRTHVAITRDIQAHPQDAALRLQRALAAIQGKAIPDRILHTSLGRLDFLTDPMVASVEEQAQRAYQLGFLGARRPDLSGLFDQSLLKEVAQ